MTFAQRSSLLSLVDAIRACSCCPADIRFRADSLEAAISPTVALFRKFGL